MKCLIVENLCLKLDFFIAILVLSGVGGGGRVPRAAVTGLGCVG